LKEEEERFELVSRERRTMASEWWWFLVLNVIVAAIAILSQARPPSSPRGGGITRRTSSAVLQRLRSSLFSFPSAGFHAASLPQPETADAPSVKPVFTPRAFAAAPPPAGLGASAPHPEAAAATVSRQTEEAAEAPLPANPISTTRALVATPPQPASWAKEMAVEEDPNAMSMEEAYALVQALRQPSDVDAKAEEFIQGFKEDLRQQRLGSIFNYTQMLKKRAIGAGCRPPAAQPDLR
jgi:hypothetical protein